MRGDLLKEGGIPYIAPRHSRAGYIAMMCALSPFRRLNKCHKGDLVGKATACNSVVHVY